MTDEATLVEAMDCVRTAHRVDGLRSVAWYKQVEQTPQDVGRGRGSVNREKRVIETIRSHIPHLARPEDTITARRQRCGWQACVIKVGHTRRSVQDAVWGSRNAYRVERLFNRLKSRRPSAPRCVRLHEHIEGRTSLLTLGVRVCTVTEGVLRRSPETAQASLPSVHPEHKHKRTAKPTAERILQAFVDIALTIIKQAAGEDILRRLTPLSGVQEDILQRLGLGATLYAPLAIRAMGT